MNFLDIINDLKKLQNLTLSSIRPGAEISIIEVDEKQEKIIVRAASGKISSRSISELRTIWDHLLSSPAVHVDEVLHGSGSSRNQPETIYANLPYIEWLKIDNKKHIAYVGKTTHAYGTIKKMDSLDASQLCEKFHYSNKLLLSLVVTKDIAQETTVVSKITGKNPIALRVGVYVYDLPFGKIVLANSDAIGICTGTYNVIHQSAFNGDFDKIISLLDVSWGVLNDGNINALIRL